MWILESDADFLQGRRMWLKPGKKYLFGRVKKDGVRFAIDHKTISRKHFVITVDYVKIGDVGRILTRSKVTITDQKSKQGTFVDGQLLKDDSRELTKPEHSIRPGAFQYALTIRWQPCVLTFSYTKKEIKADALKSKRERLEELDIKVIAEYVNTSTTHVVAGKRNTAKGLQALVQGRYIVGDSYVDALVYASTPVDLEEEETLSPLEQDFDSSWPKEADYLPPPGKEPTARPDSAYSRDPTRGNVFENFIFVFGDQTQYENLLPAIALGQGEALLFKVINGETTTDELVKYMQNTAGQKGFGDAQNDTDVGGVVMVRWSGKDQYSDWTQSLINEVALKLDQRAIDQAEFLDAILANDALTLRQTIPYANTVQGYAAPPPSALSFQTIPRIPAGPVEQSPKLRNDDSIKIPSSFQTAPSQPLPPAPPPSSAATAGDAARMPPSAVETITNNGQSAPTAANGNEEDPPPPKRSRLRGAPIPKFAEFDDGFDDSGPLFRDEDNEDSKAASQSQAPSQSQPYPNSRDISVEASINVKDERVSTGRKRRRSPSLVRDTDSMDDGFEYLSPAAAATKRRKFAETRSRDSLSPPFALRPLPTPSVNTRPKKKQKEIDVREVARAQRQQEEEAARKEKKELREDLLAFDSEDKQPANLAVVVAMDLPVRSGKPPLQSQLTKSERWDPAWNGRKNFKKFRKSRVGGEGGGDAADRNRSRQVILPLVAAKTKSYGLGDQYWDRQEEVGQNDDSDEDNEDNEDESVSQRRKAWKGKGKEKQTTGRQREIQTQSQMLSMFGNNSRINSRRDLSSSQSPSRSASPTKTALADKTSSQNIRKRAPPASSSKGGGSRLVKKQKTIPTVAIHGSDSEDSEDLKFEWTARRPDPT